VNVHLIKAVNNLPYGPIRLIARSPTFFPWKAKCDLCRRPIAAKVTGEEAQAIGGETDRRPEATMQLARLAYTLRIGVFDRATLFGAPVS